MMTRVPSWSTARCVCPIEAAASGSQSNEREGLIDRLAQLGLDHGGHVLFGDRSHVGAQARQLVRQGPGKDVGPRRGDLPELDEHPAGFLEHVAKAARELGRLERLGRRIAPVQELLPAGVADDLAEARVRRERGSRRPDRMKEHTSSPPARPVGRPAHEELEGDRRGQRGQHAEEHDDGHGDEPLPESGGLERPAASRRLVAEHVRRRHDPYEPTDHPDDEAAPGPETDAEQTAADRPHDQHQEDEQQDADESLHLSTARGSAGRTPYSARAR